MAFLHNTSFVGAARYELLLTSFCLSAISSASSS